jgi:hypothetical protein
MGALTRITFAFLGLLLVVPAYPAAAQTSPPALVNHCYVEKNLGARASSVNAFRLDLDFTNTSERVASLIDVTLYLRGQNGATHAYVSTYKGTYSPGALVRNPGLFAVSPYEFDKYACAVTHVDYTDGTSWDAPSAARPRTAQDATIRQLQARIGALESSLAARPAITTVHAEATPVPVASARPKPGGLLDAGSPVSLQSCAIGQYNGDGPNNGAFILTVDFTNESAKPVTAVEVILAVSDADGKVAQFHDKISGAFAPAEHVTGKKMKEQAAFHITKRACKIARVDYADGTAWNAPPVTGNSP